MFGSEINDILTSDLKASLIFRGVFASDTLPKYLEKGKSHALIVNLDSSEKKGTHWIAIYISYFEHLTYFDPLGLPPFIESINNFIKNNCKTHNFNKMTIQNILSYTCGYYCIYFIRNMVRGVNLREFQSLFKNTHYNDAMILNVYDKT